MKIKKFLFIALMFIFAGSAAFAGTIEITSPYYGEDFYAYNCDSVYDFNVKFKGTVSGGCTSIRVIWTSGKKKNITKYLIQGKKTKITGGDNYQIDDFTLKQYQKGTPTFEYNVSGRLENLAFGSNYYLFIATFADGSIDVAEHEIFVYQGGAAEKAKPVIYLYPTKKQDVKVKVSPEGGVTESIPEYGKGWKVTATPDGTIIDKATKTEYPYLFWESKDYGDEIDMSEGFVVETKNLQAFFEEKLAILGLNEKEIADFTEYWVPELQGKKYVFITFYSQERIDSEAPLKISPKPDSIIRVYFDHKKLDQKITVKEQVLTPAARTGFAVIEWGGKRYKEAAS